MIQENFKKVICPICNTNYKIRLVDKNKYSLYFCENCKNGFVNPQPKNLDEFYPEIYWQNLGPFASIRRDIHISFQKKRVKYFKDYLVSGEILDVGAGEGDFGKILGSDFKVTNLEYPTSKVKASDIIKLNFLKWKTKKKFDAIVFLESLEHMTNPQRYLAKAATLLKKEGYIFVEYPRFDCLESRIFGRYWLNRDIPRHLFHFTEEGLRKIANKVYLKVLIQRGILTYEYSPYCLLASVIQILKLPSLNLRLGLIKNLPTLIFLLIGTPLAFILETLLYLLGESPVGLIVLKRK